MNDQTHSMKHRLELFSDAIFAIILTVMLLDLHAPNGTDWQAWKQLIPELMAYTVTFLFLLVLWLHHQHLFSHFEHITKGMFWANGCGLLVMSLLPLALQNFSNHPRVPIALDIWLVMFTLVFALQTIMRLVANSSHTRDPEWEAWMKKRNSAALRGYSISAAIVGLSFVSVRVAMACVVINLALLITTL